MPTTSFPIFFFIILYMSMLYTSMSTLCEDPIAHCRDEGGPPDAPVPSIVSYNGETSLLMSEGGRFLLGFFDSGNYTYMGISYSEDPSKVIVWVTRNSPMPFLDSGEYVLTIADDGNAKIRTSFYDDVNYWSTNCTKKPSNASNVILQLLDDGNLILVEKGGNGGTLWQSFDHPTNTFLYGMDISKSGDNLISWKSPQDPARGYNLFKQMSNKLLLYDNSSQRSSSTPYWDSTFSSLHHYLTPLLWHNMTEISLLKLRLVMNSTGSVQLWELQVDINNPNYWSMLWEAPNSRCDLVDACGSFGVCDAGNTFRCKCLPGYNPSKPVKWESDDFSGDCSKRTNDQCGQMFLSMPMVKLPPYPNITSEFRNETQCRDLCLSTCGHRAYSFDWSQSRCLIWSENLTHIQEEYYSPSARTLHIRLTQSDIDQYGCCGGAESGSRTCSICGTNVIPYPLSTNRDCGDPIYFSFQCNATNGQVYFKPPSGHIYKVSLINANRKRFVVQLATVNTSGTCNIANTESKVFNLNNSSPFSVINCSTAPLTDKQVVDVELSWKPPQPPVCISSADCKDWPETTCAEHTQGKKSCLCNKGFKWDSILMNCTTFPQFFHHKHMPSSLKAGIATTSGAVLLLFGSILFILHLQRKRAIQRAGNVNQFKMDDLENIDIPFVDYQSILAATDNFSETNKLGAGGFGPVYKGKLTDGNEVAVKRLSAASAQGIEEFRNEVILIAKLQHRNLVRVLGYCMKEDEKILIYEYMPNKSLSSYIFDQTLSPSLDWMKRFNIILGIARGLLYLHQDSRLRIIHRDMKPSNILLDEELNPKISDFGLARIVAGNEMATNTARVVGTYGYMPPEYALDGYFSIKTDVYSFGIIVLEVISGRKCTSLFQFEDCLISLLGYAWTLWDKAREMELVDRSIMDTCDSSEVKRCINLALLCVQEDPSDRPTMPNVLLMLGGGDSINLLRPNQPVFVARKPPLETPSKFGTSNSNVELTGYVIAGYKYYS